MNRVMHLEDTETLLHYLLVTHPRSARTLDALHELSDDAETIDQSLAELIDHAYVCEDDGVFVLTFAGIYRARRIQSFAQSEQQELIDEIHALHEEEIQADIPTLHTHPLRTGAEHQRSTAEARPQTLQYLLAFETPRNVLPIPILNGDVLGRLAEVDISLRHDEFISSEHCRFTIESKHGQATLYVEDLGSRNGTSVNGLQITKNQRFALEHGDRIHVGSTILIVVKIPTSPTDK